MRTLRKNWLIRLIIFFGGIFSVRLVSYLLHMTTLEKLYKPRDFRKTSHLEISPKILDQLPRHCQTLFGRKMDPINLIFIGTEAGLRRAFEKAGWHGAHPHSPLLAPLSMIPGLFNRRYSKGPFSPLYINVGLQDLSYQKVLKTGYGNRHHLRIWRTRHELKGGNRIWVCAATYESGYRMGMVPPFFYHQKEPDLDWERDFVTDSLLEHGNMLIDAYQLNEPISAERPKRDPHRDTYFSNGKANAIEII